MIFCVLPHKHTLMYACLMITCAASVNSEVDTITADDGHSWMSGSMAGIVLVLVVIIYVFKMRGNSFRHQTEEKEYSDLLKCEIS
jgi:hypothetical protein